MLVNARFATLDVNVTCDIDGVPAVGATLDLTYRITTNKDTNVGAGAGFYDTGVHAPTDLYPGIGNIDATPIRANMDNVLTRVFVVPAVKPGLYEITAEIWPANRIGASGESTYADISCGAPIRIV